MMFRILDHWLISRALDDEHPLPGRVADRVASSPELRRDRDALQSVHESLRDSADAHFVPSPAGLRERTLDAVRRSSRPARARRQVPWRVWLGVTAAAALTIMLSIRLLLAPGPAAGPAPGALTERVVQPEGPVSLAAMLDRLQPSSLRVSLEAPIQSESRQLLTDARRTADLLLEQIPFLQRERREQ